jgi:heat shock protein HslJ
MGGDTQHAERVRRGLLIVMLACLCGCGPEADQAAQGPPLEGTPWVLAAGIDVPGWETVAPSASFAAGTLGGNNGCNRYTANYELDGAALTLEPAFTTKKACGPPGDAVQTAFTAALERVAGWRSAGSELTLVDSGDREVLRFQEASPVGSWEATMVRLPDSVSSLIEGTRITAVFEDDGTLSGSAGCNDYSGTFSRDRGALKISSLSATEMACESPAGVMEQEQAFLEALPLATGYAVEGTGLTLLTREGTIVATFTRAG